MEGRGWLIVAVFICLFGFSSCRELKVTVKHKHNQHHHLATYNHTLARILVQYASAVYLSDLTELFTWTCSRCDGLTKDFEMVELIVDVKRCLQGFVGVATDLNAIVIAFRGTQERSIQNWVEDLYWKQLDIDYPGVDGAMVHHGFYTAYHNTSVRPGVLRAVRKVKNLYGDIKIMVTGHSMGGAMAALCGLDLRLSLGEQNVQVMTFGQPRIGNAVFASYFNQIVPDTIRVTNGHDIVPHLPPYYYYFPQKTYHHFPREVWLYNIGLGSLIYTVEKVCDGSGEDPTCSRQVFAVTGTFFIFPVIIGFTMEDSMIRSKLDVFLTTNANHLKTFCRSVRGNSISDHLKYYGVEMGCDTPSGCRIVMDPRVVAYARKDLDGNLILSRDLSNSILKLNTDRGDQGSSA
ncbi:UNVERIFIED_CONTAM: Lipase A [Sesamum indicum]